MFADHYRNRSGVNALSPHIPHVERRAVTIASVPAAHSYVQNALADAQDAGLLTVLDDPHPAGAPAGQWWPPVMLDAAWIEQNARSFDLLHVHFGFESFTVEQLTRTVDALRLADRPLVLTVHDLENPQLSDQGDYPALLGLLIDAADEIITLTPGAAAEIENRWQREAILIPHPRVLARTVEAASGKVRRTAPRVGVQLRDLRPNIDALNTVRLLIDAAERLAGEGRPVTVVVDINDRVRDEVLRVQLERLVGDSHVAEWNEHPRLSDDDLTASIASLGIVVLPYRHGTHSGWLELCWDLGVDVLAPGVGFYGEQHCDASIALFDPASAPSFDAALEHLLTRAHEPLEAVRRRRRDARLTQSGQIAEAHLAVYRRALARVRA
ncbi:glycosyltransferase [Subtercola lobariae]|uniref:D-inositol 3-phosphate glycosyltransferase n=1 Tax=Subtercola lobariae TaxID=1588641 RepID=A0A917BFY7_9MICO|nr:glycosyltransferase [Subtercola lobariae]GGF41346.1 hypothetical protein GCM10011399_37550 [Subtercola lobariae]